MPFNFSFTSSALCKAMCHSHTLFLPISSTPASYCKLQSARPAAALASRSGSAKGIRCNASEQLSAVSATEPLQPLTKARKKLKVPNARSAGRGLQSAGSVVSYAALAFGAGVAMMAVAGPEAAAASAVLAAGQRYLPNIVCCVSVPICATPCDMFTGLCSKCQNAVTSHPKCIAGAAILPSIGPGARNKAQVSVKGRCAPVLECFLPPTAALHVVCMSACVATVMHMIVVPKLFAEGHQTMLGAFSSGPAAKHVTAAIQQAVKPSTRSSHKPLQSCFHSLAPNMSTSEQSDTGLETQWDNEEDLEDDDQGMTNAQWAAIAKVQWTCAFAMWSQHHVTPAI